MEATNIINIVGKRENAAWPFIHNPNPKDPERESLCEPREKGGNDSNQEFSFSCSSFYCILDKNCYLGTFVFCRWYQFRSFQNFIVWERLWCSNFLLLSNCMHIELDTGIKLLVVRLLETVESVVHIDRDRKKTQNEIKYSFIDCQSTVIGLILSSAY